MTRIILTMTMDTNDKDTDDSDNDNGNENENDNDDDNEDDCNEIFPALKPNIWIEKVITFKNFIDWMPKPFFRPLLESFWVRKGHLEHN